MWVGDTVYFLSDRAEATTLFAYDTHARSVRQLIPNENGFDIQSASAGPGAIVYDQFGELRLYDLASRQTRRVDVTIDADLPQLRPRFEKVDPEQILHAAISPTGKRVLFEAHGEILAVPAEKGDTRNLTRTPGVADRDPSWSPDGRWIAWFSDESGEYALHLRAPDGLGPVRKIDLGEPPSFFYLPRWSPDSKKIAYTDKRMNLWVVDIGNPKPVKIDTDLYDTPFHHLDPAWSPDSRWIAYTKQLRNYLRAVFVYSVAKKKSWQLTDGRSDATSPRFDRSGNYLYFLASTSAGLSQGWLDMTSMARPVTSNVYAAVLRKDLPSPVAPESDEEEPDAAQTSAEEKAVEEQVASEKAPEPVRIDFDGLDQRIVALPIERANYVALETGAEGVLFLVAAPTILTDQDYIELEKMPAQTVLRFDLETRKTETLLEKIDGGTPIYGSLVTFAVSVDGAKVLFAQDGKWFLTASEQTPEAGGEEEEGREWRAEDCARGVRGPARRVAADVPGGLAPAARLPVRAKLPRPRSETGGARLRAVRRGHRQPRRPEPALPRDDRKSRARPLVRGGRHRAEAGARERGAARRGLPRRGRPLPVRANPLRRELESRAAGAADAAGGECSRRGVPARRQRTGAARRRQPVPVLPGDGREADRPHGGSARERIGRATGDRGADRVRGSPASAHVDGTQSPPRG
jgi:tricorn protease-like protein